MTTAVADFDLDLDVEVELVAEDAPAVKSQLTELCSLWTDHWCGGC